MSSQKNRTHTILHKGDLKQGIDFINIGRSKEQKKHAEVTQRLITAEVSSNIGPGNSKEELGLPEPRSSRWGSSRLVFRPTG